MLGLALPLHHTTTLCVELYACRLGLQAISLLGMSKVIVETDSIYLHHLLTSNECEIPTTIATIIRDIKFLLAQIGEYKLQWNYRETNFVADGFANYASYQASNQQWIVNPQAHRPELPDQLTFYLLCVLFGG
ncbi:hypothetical protein IFM89_018763 [Coptis chinensis]|uniref:RNase H type-1 domain-containing protein n=1 Tax=Coptis chinensis TaxID=261450 RepID=A0A835HL25_9MAGN|nr:hypothetical protein IFM89_018763 [Coptis chinensis]